MHQLKLPFKGLSVKKPVQHFYNINSTIMHGKSIWFNTLCGTNTRAQYASTIESLHHITCKKCLKQLTTVINRLP